MSLYRMHGNLIRETSVEEEVGVAVVGGMATAAGWLIGLAYQASERWSRTRATDGFFAELKK